MRNIYILILLFITTPVFGATQQVISSGSLRFGDLDAATTEYIALVGNSANQTWSSTEPKEMVVPASGTFDDIRIKLENAPDNGGGTQSYTFTVQLDAVNTTLTCAVSEAETTCDNSSGFSVTAGQKVRLQVVPANTPTIGIVYWSTIWNPTTDDRTIVMGGTAATDMSTSVSENWAMSGQNDADAGTFEVSQLFPTGGTITKLYVEVDTAPDNGAGTQTRTFTYGSSACTISEADTTCNDTSSTTAITAGDDHYLVTTLANTPAATTASWAIVFEPTTTGQFVFFMTSDGTLNSTTTEFQPISSIGDSDWDSVKADQSSLANAFTLKNMYVEVEALPGSGNTYDFTPVDASGDLSATFTCQITNSSKLCNDAEDYAVSNDDLLAVEVVPASTPDAVKVLIGFTGYLAPTSSGRRIIMTQ